MPENFKISQEVWDKVQKDMEKFVREDILYDNISHHNIAHKSSPMRVGVPSGTVGKTIINAASVTNRWSKHEKTNKKEKKKPMTQSMKPSKVEEFITTSLKCGQVPYIAGAPGIGKSDIVRKIANKFNAKVIDLRLSQVLSEDLTGLPERNTKTGKAEYLPFDTFPLLGDAIPEGYDGWILFLDELSSASEEVMAAAYSLILDRTVGGKELHPKCLVVGAGNRASDSAIARELPATLVTRMLCVTMEANAKDWIKWAISPVCKHSNEMVVEFIKENPSMIYSAAKEKDREELEAYNNPRGWGKAMRIVNEHEEENSFVRDTDENGIPIPEDQQCREAKPIKGIVHAMLAACVGVPSATVFVEFYNDKLTIPHAFEIAKAPTSSAIPGTHLGKAKVTTSVAEYFLETEDEDEKNNCLLYMNRIGGEFSELFTTHIKHKLDGNKKQDSIVEGVSKRLGIDLLLGTVKPLKNEELDIPFLTSPNTQYQPNKQC